MDIVDEFDAELSELLPPFCTPQQLSHAIGIPVGTLAAWRTQHRGPQSIKAEGRVLYARHGVAEWLADGLDDRSMQ